MYKKQNITEIEELIRCFHDDIIDDNFVCDVYDEDGCTIYDGDVNFTEIVLYTDGNVKVWGVDTYNGKNRSFSLNRLPFETVKRIYEGLRTRRKGYKQENVENRTREIVTEMKKRFDELVEKSFNTSAFDWDEAFQNGYVIPKAIVAAACKAIMNECINSNFEIQDEADNIYRFL